MRDATRRTIYSALPRIAVDLFLINAALLIAYVSRVIVGFAQHPEEAIRGRIVSESVALYGYNVGIVCGITLVVFGLFGFYTRRRFYARRYKLASVLQASGVAGLSYVTLAFLVREQWLLPRSVVLVTFGLIFLFCGGARYLKWKLEERYVVQSRAKPQETAGPKTVLVIGGAGHLGSVLCRQLLAAGYRVRVLDVLMFGDDAISELYENDDFELIKGDFRHVEMVVRATRGVHAVVHMGAIVGDPACAVDEDYSVDVNYAATRMIREVCRGFGVRRFVFASTCSVYGASDHVLDERSALHPVSLYARTKIESEQAILALRDETFSPTILRLGTVFGLSPRPRFDLVVNLVTAMATKEGSCTIFGGSQWRPFIHVEDVARAILTVLRAPEAVVSGQIYNVGDDRLNMQLSELGDLVANLIPSADVVRKEDNVDLRNYRVSFNKIREHLGFNCEWEVEAGIAEIRDAVKSGKIPDFRDPHYSNLNYLRRLREAGDPSAQRLEDDEVVVALRPPRSAS